MPSLNWIVPCRRAVVTARTDYYTLLDEWERDLCTHEGAIRRWYGVEESGYETALMRLVDWKVYFCLAGENAVSLEEVNLFDVQDLIPFYVRLWKGPLRVLLEAGNFPPAVTPVPAPPFQWNDNKEVEDRSTEFLMGDVIEFPLHKILQASGLSQYGNITFNPNGSFFLGTSLKEGDNSPPTSLTLHENMVGMRFQLLLNAAVGSFYRLDHVFNGDGRNSEPHAAEEGSRVYSRGLVYGATLGNPHRVSEGDHWAIFTGQWGYAPQAHVTPEEGDPLPEALPSTSTAAYYPPDLPFTSGWSCSPCTIFLSYFLFNRDDFGRGSISDEWAHVTETTHVPDSPLLDYYDRFTDEEAAENFQLNISPPERRNVSNVFRDVNVLAFALPRWSGPQGGHEIAVVRIYPSDRLMREERIPFAGFLSAYHPLSGRDYFWNPDLAEEGQLWTFEAAGFLGGREGGGRWCGANPFHWEIISDNRMTVYRGRMRNDPRQSNRLRISTYNLNPEDNPRPPDPPAPRYIQEMYLLKPSSPMMSAYSPRETLKPVVVHHPVAQNSVWTQRSTPVLENIEQVYAERAVPFPTMDEARGKFPQARVVRDLSGQCAE